MSDVSLILLAGGIGSRMQMPLPKQFIELHGKPIFRYSLRVFYKIESIKEMIVVCDPLYRHFFKGENVKFALPGKLRQDSVYNGLMEVSSDTNLVCLHDAARPFIDVNLVEDVIKAAVTYGAATLAVPIHFTIKKGDENGFVEHTVDRKGLFEIQTPQVIRYDLLKKGFEHVNSLGVTVTDDVSVVESLGERVKLVKGSPHNIKITTPEDLEYAKFLQQLGV